MVSTDWDENIILPKENYFRNSICPACLDLTYASIALNEPGIYSDVKSPIHINSTNAINISSVGWMRRTPGCQKRAKPLCIYRDNSIENPGMDDNF